ncbi:MAG: nucleoside monophosphate kinase [Patescibacteria group bacterium]
MINEREAFIFIGRSGCGKGTQTALLTDYLKQQGVVNDQHPLFYLESGEKFRQFTKGSSHSSRLAKVLMEAGARQPDFLAVWNWGHILVENLMGDEHIIFDGTPRSLLEAQALETALVFYGYAKKTVVYLDVSNDWSTKRLLERGRGADDKSVKDIATRLAWFETDVLPAVDYYRHNSSYKFIEIKGERSIEAIHDDLIATL